MPFGINYIISIYKRIRFELLDKSNKNAYYATGDFIF
jgi:hypothetical protein